MMRSPLFLCFNVYYFTIKSLQSAVCGLQFANVIHRLITGLTKIQFLGGNASIPPNTPKMGGGGGGAGIDWPVHSLYK